MLLNTVYFSGAIPLVPATGEVVAGDIVAKLVHRHPHVFAGLDVADVEEVERNWESLKASEKQRTSVLDGVPLALPALTLAQKCDLTADEVAPNVFAHPTLSEAVKEAIEGIAGHMIHM